MEDFLELSRDNTNKDLETCGVLGAFLVRFMLWPNAHTPRIDIIHDHSVSILKWCVSLLSFLHQISSFMAVSKLNIDNCPMLWTHPTMEACASILTRIENSIGDWDLVFSEPTDIFTSPG